MRRNRVRYILAVNSRSSSRSCVLVKAVRIRLLENSSSSLSSKVGEGVDEVLTMEFVSYGQNFDGFGGDE